MSRERRAEGDHWVFSQARTLGFAADDSSLCLVGTAWHLVALALILPTPLSSHRGRILITGPSRSALFKANVTRDDPTELIWAGPTRDLHWRIGPRWLVRGETPGGHLIYIDAPSERRKVRRELLST